MSAVNGHTLQPALRHVLDGRGANLAESRLIFNASSEVDSLIEEIQALPVPADVKRRLLGYCREIFTLNTSEGESERQAAGILDATITALRDDALNHGNRCPFTVKALARKLRPALAIIATPPAKDALAFVNAVRAVDEVINLVPAHQLLTPSVQNQLGAGRYRLLTELVAERTAA